MRSTEGRCDKILPEKADKGEIAQHLVETVAPKVSSNRVGIPLVVVHLKGKVLHLEGRFEEYL